MNINPNPPLEATADEMLYGGIAPDGIMYLARSYKKGEMFSLEAVLTNIPEHSRERMFGFLLRRNHDFSVPLKFCVDQQPGKNCVSLLFCDRSENYTEESFVRCLREFEAGAGFFGQEVIDQFGAIPYAEWWQMQRSA